nr:IS30 family transposase [Acidaminococcus fermentans]
MNLNCAGVESVLAQLQELYGAERFSQIFKMMTADNGPEFENLSQFESLGTKMYSTHPYSSWERAQNEYHNGLLRDFIPKGMSNSIEQFTDEDILNMADTLNQRLRRVLGYHTPSELFDVFLDEVYAIECVS